jgi:hypothetical protein
VIELLLAAERMLAVGLLDQAERLFRQVAEADPRNAIAVVGLARVALGRGDEPGAMAEARRAMGIDPENVAARRMLDRLEEVIAARTGGPSASVAPGEPRSVPVNPIGGGPGSSDARPSAPAFTKPVRLRSILDRIWALLRRR